MNKGVRVKKVYGHESKTEISVGDLRYGDLKQTLLDLEIDSKFAFSGELPVLAFELVHSSQEETGICYLYMFLIKVNIDTMCS